MKKILTILMLMTIFFGMNKGTAQTNYVSADFETGLAPMTSTIATTGGLWVAGSNQYNPYLSLDPHTKYALINDFGCGCVEDSARLTTPTFNTSASAQVYITYDYLYSQYHLNSNGATEIFWSEYSINGGVTWMLLDSVPAVSVWTSRTLDRSAQLANHATVAVRFVFSDRGYAIVGAALDNIHIYSPAMLDLSASSINTVDYVAPGNVTISGNIFNYGSSTITSMTLNYQIDASTVVSSNLSALSIAPLTSYAYSHPTPWNAPSTSGLHTIKVWASNLNGSSDQNTANDQVSKPASIYTHSDARMDLMEEFTQASCPPCAAQNPAFNALMDANTTEAVNIKYHTNWPGSDNLNVYNPTDVADRVSYYGISGVPAALLDAVQEPGVNYTGAPANVTQAMIDAEFAKPALYNINVSGSISGSTLTVSGSVKSDIFSIHPVYLYVALTEDMIGYNAGGTNGETDFPQALRKMWPSGNGLLVGTVTDLQNTPFNYTFTVPSNFVKANLKVVAFVQESSSSMVHNAAGALVTTGIEEANSTLSTFDIYPNPFTNNATIAFTLKNSENVSVEIYNMLGAKVCNIQNGLLGAGMQQINLNGQNLASGLYFVKLTAGNYSISQKISLNK